MALPPPLPRPRKPDSSRRKRNVVPPRRRSKGKPRSNVPRPRRREYKRKKRKRGGDRIKKNR